MPELKSSVQICLQQSTLETWLIEDLKEDYWENKFQKKDSEI